MSIMNELLHELDARFERGPYDLKDTFRGHSCG